MTPRRANQVLQERVVLSVDHAQVTGDTTIKFWKVPTGRSFILDRALYINPTGLAEDAGNWFQVAVKKGSTVMADTNTDSDSAGADNSIAADTFTELAKSATAANLVAASDDVLSLVLDETGTATLPAGKLVVEGRLV